MTTENEDRDELLLRIGWAIDEMALKLGVGVEQKDLHAALIAFQDKFYGVPKDENDGD